jgi:dTDP-4-amino-4,6-dideoxygalactose transaminase
MACKKRDGLRKYLLNNGVENKVFYSPLVCDAKVYRNSLNKINIPVARRLLNQSLSIPLHEKMTMKQTKYVIDTSYSYYN